MSWCQIRLLLWTRSDFQHRLWQSRNQMELFSKLKWSQRAQWQSYLYVWSPQLHPRRLRFQKSLIQNQSWALVRLEAVILDLKALKFQSCYSGKCRALIRIWSRALRRSVLLSREGSILRLSSHQRWSRFLGSSFRWRVSRFSDFHRNPCKFRCRINQSLSKLSAYWSRAQTSFRMDFRLSFLPRNTLRR